MRVKISTSEETMKELLVRRGLSGSEAAFVASDYLAAEMRGKKTHGVSKFLKELDYLAEPRGKPEVIVERESMVLVDAKMEIGQLAAAFCVDLAVRHAKRYGIAIVGMKNAKRYGLLEPWARAIAENDLIGIVANSCEPAGVPYGASSAVLGSNPLAIGIPTSREPIVMDMATTELSMSTIWNSILENRKLPETTFFDKKGTYTTEPSEAVAAEIFGGHKGYAISTAIEILSGSLVSAMMGSMIKSPYDIGYYFQATDPSVFQDIEKFKAENTRLVEEIKSAMRKPGVGEIFIPGEQGSARYREAFETGTLDLSENITNALAEALR